MIWVDCGPFQEHPAEGEMVQEKCRLSIFQIFQHQNSLMVKALDICEKLWPSGPFWSLDSFLRSSGRSGRCWWQGRILERKSRCQKPLYKLWQTKTNAQKHRQIETEGAQEPSGSLQCCSFSAGKKNCCLQLWCVWLSSNWRPDGSLRQGSILRRVPPVRPNPTRNWTNWGNCPRQVKPRCRTPRPFRSEKQRPAESATLRSFGRPACGECCGFGRPCMPAPSHRSSLAAPRPATWSVTFSP